MSTNTHFATNTLPPWTISGASISFRLQTFQFSHGAVRSVVDEQKDNYDDEEKEDADSEDDEDDELPELIDSEDNELREYATTEYENMVYEEVD